MIRASELDGITHDTEIEDYIPELVPGTPEYDETLRETSKQVEDPEFYGLFSDTSEQIRDATNNFFDELHNTLYLLDNGEQQDAMTHLENARESYEQLEGAYEEFMSFRVEIGVEEELGDYLTELGHGLTSVEQLVPGGPTPSAESGEPRKAS